MEGCHFTSVFFFFLLIIPVPVSCTMSFRLAVFFPFRTQAEKTQLTAVDMSCPGKIKDSLELQESRDWNEKLFLCIICARPRDVLLRSTSGVSKTKNSFVQYPPLPFSSPQLFCLPPFPLGLCKWLRVICTHRVSVCTQTAATLVDKRDNVSDVDEHSTYIPKAAF